MTEQKKITALPSHYFWKNPYPINNCVSCRESLGTCGVEFAPIVFKYDLCRNRWCQCDLCVEQKIVFDSKRLEQASVKLYYDIDGVMEKCVCKKCFSSLKTHL